MICKIWKFIIVYKSVYYYKFFFGNKILHIQILASAYLHKILLADLHHWAPVSKLRSIWKLLFIFIISTEKYFSVLSLQFSTSNGISVAFYALPPGSPFSSNLILISFLVSTSSWILQFPSFQFFNSWPFYPFTPTYSLPSYYHTLWYHFFNIFLSTLPF